MIVPWVFHRAIILPIFCFCSNQLLNAMLPTSGTSMFSLITEIFGMKDFEDVRGLCNLSILWGEKKDIGWVELCHIITYGLLLYSSWRRSCHFLASNRLLLPWHFLLLPAQLCQDIYHAILQAGSLNNFPKERGIGGIISWDHLADPAVSLLSGGCISTAKGVTNRAPLRNGWEGGGRDRQHCHPKEHPQSAKGRAAGLHSHTLSDVMAKPLAVTGMLL